jgi:hypothetical protein
MKKEEKFEYDDKFKEDLIHQLWHLVEQIKKMNVHLKEIAAQIEIIRIDGIYT